MPISRRAFLTGSLAGAGVLVLSACTSPTPTPTASTGTASATPTPTPTNPSGVVPKAFRRSKWGTDPYTYGSSSYLTSTATDSDRATLATSIDDKLFFAGEAVAASDPGSLAGAHTSGLAAAAAVAAVAKSGERIAVIGAGMAGATAARALKNDGFDVVVVEARHRVGGRIASYESDAWPLDVQLGVGTLFGDGAADLGTILSGAGVTLQPLDSTTAATTPSKATPFPLTASVEAAVANAFAWSEKQSAEVTVTTAFDTSGASARLSTTDDASGVSDADRLAYLLGDLLPARFGADAGDLSARALGDGLAPVGAQLVTGGLADYITAQLKGLDVLRGSNVTQIDYGNQGIGLRLVTGESLSADRVVSTIPLGVLKKKKIVFKPELPVAHLSAMDKIGMGTQDVLWLQFDERLWSTDATIWAVLDETADYPLWINLEPSTGFPILVALTGGANATALEKSSDAEAVAAALTSITPYLDIVPSTASPTPSPSPTSPTPSS